jgi:hypothetical protein
MKKKMNITSVQFFLELPTPLIFLFTLEVTTSNEPIYLVRARPLFELSRFAINVFGIQSVWIVIVFVEGVGRG